MGFEKVEDCNNNLYLSDLSSLDTFKKICYVMDYSSGITKNQLGFYSLTIKTADGESIRAQIFNPKNFMTRGLDIASLKNKFILLEGVGRVWNGSYSIIVDEIYTVEQSSVKNREVFIGAIENLNEIFNECNNIFKSKDLILPSIYKLNSYPSIEDGKVGGYIKFLWQWIFEVIPYDSELDDDLVEVLYYTSNYYSKYLDKINVLDIVTDRDKINILKEIPPNVSNVSSIVDDLLSSMLGISSPEHIVSHLLYDSFVKIQTFSRLKSMWKVMPSGGVKKLEDEKYLRKY